MSAQTFFVKCGNRYREASSSEVCERASSYLFAKAVTDRPTLASPIAAKDFVRAQAGLDFEQFGIVYLDTRHRVINVEILFNGTIDGASVHPREVARRALQESAAAVIIFHNHPSGNPEPSQADIKITSRLKDALGLLDIRLLDHLIVAGTLTVSLAERGHI